uniref:phosphate acetyltransferase n=1 Tax=Vaginimicrobium propionicum TaxID=1871034 RepID=UPI000970DFC1|nr:phosphate acetyltransferase [Vaginimicrobium propionicum]
MTSKAIFIAATEPRADKGAVARQLLTKIPGGQSVAIFRPVVEPGHDELTASLLEAANCPLTAAEAIGVSPSDWAKDEVAAIHAIVEKFGQLAKRFDNVVVVGSDYSSVIAASALGVNVTVAANLNLPVVVVVDAKLCDKQWAEGVASNARAAFEAAGLSVVGTAFCGDDDVDFDVCSAISACDAPRQQVRTPAMFEFQINELARADKKTIVLPEAEDERILEAASIVLNNDVANIVLLGEENEVRSRAQEHGFDISKAKIVSLQDPDLVERFSAKYAELRAHKGVTIEQARQRMSEPSYFATMMIHEQMADGMVSGAAHTTANTIRPSLEFIKTKPGVKVVSGCFLMCLADRVLVFADCAVTPNPSPEQLADIAITSAATARDFGIEPRVALISYSTGTSGAGVDVDAVKAATDALAERNPDFGFAGPIQFDAAIDPVVGKKKMPENPVAGNATVFIFPDLNTGNTAYKAVQRTAGATAIGPVLQGLKKPVNDLSRGALVADIVNTIVITAIQAQTS